MRPNDIQRAAVIKTSLLHFSQSNRQLLGIQPAGYCDTLVEQIIESMRRVEYVIRLRSANIEASCADPSKAHFDPLKAALIHRANGDIDEAFWLVFLATYFGKHREDKWRLIRDIYGALGSSDHWTWKRTSANPAGFRAWLTANENTLLNDGLSRRFSSHRQYETIRTSAARGTATVFESYVSWIGPNRGHQLLIDEAKNDVGSDPKILFHRLYQKTNVHTFGRLGKFDFLTMLGKLQLVDIEPGSPYLKGATGPLRGARLLFDGTTSSTRKAAEMDAWLIELGNHTHLGMQVIEDSLCNWQKSPGLFIPFRG